MNNILISKIDNRWIYSKRGSKNPTDPFKPFAFFVEEERTHSGNIESFATIFLTNNECPFACLMCDLWKNTTDKPVPPGAIPAQIEYALNRLPAAQNIKLYNSGSFFDTNAIPPEDYKKIAEIIRDFGTVVVESHPVFVNKQVKHFQSLLTGQLQVAVGLETIHPEVLPRLNKKMTPESFRKAVHFLIQNDIIVRSFILLKPPYLTEEESIQWAINSIDFAFDSGVSICTIIPVRAGNGIMEWLLDNGWFHPPHLRSLEQTLELAIRKNQGLVFADLWDLEQFADCDICFDKRKERLNEMNLLQKVLPEVMCACI